MKGSTEIELKLHIERFAAEMMMPSIKVDVARRSDLRGWLVRTWGDFPTQHLQRETVEWPANWWQHFRERWFPRRWLRRWPVRYACRVFDSRLVYPHMQLPEDRYGASYPVLIRKLIEWRAGGAPV